jgi:hypothetical protein
MSLFLFHATEDGGRLRLLGERGSDDVVNFLDDPEYHFGITKFLSLSDFLASPDPMYWNNGEGFLIEGKEIIPLPAKGVRLP